MNHKTLQQHVLLQHVTVLLVTASNNRLSNQTHQLITKLQNWPNWNILPLYRFQCN